MKHRADVQGLRGVAVTLVVAQHVAGHPRGGFIGVDTFFVLSGFLITGLLLAEQQRTGHVSLRDFYARRVRRILPVASLTLVVTVLLSRLLLGPVRGHRTLLDAGWALAFGANVHFQHTGADYFSAFQAPSPVQHYWSLAVEEQFYVVWPLLLAVLLRFSRTAVGASLALIVVASFAYGVHTVATSPRTAYFSTPSRAWELACGAALALLVSRGLGLGSPARTALGWLGAGMLGLSSVGTLPGHFPGRAALAPVVATVLLLVAGTGEVASGSVSGPYGLGSAPLRWVGDRSYSIYLWHLPVIVLARSLVFDSVASRVAVLTLTLALSAATYAMVERPVLRSSWLKAGRWRPSRPAGVVVAASALLAVCAVVVSPDPRPPAPPSITSEVLTIRASILARDQLIRDVQTAASLDAWPIMSPSRALTPLAQPAEFHTPGCSNQPRVTLQACVFGLPSADKDAVVVGDSMSISWLPGIRQALEPRGFRVHVAAYDTCPFAPVEVDLDGDARRSGACNRAHAALVEAIAAVHPQLVITSDIETGLLNLRSHASGSAATSEWGDALGSRIRELRSLGTRVVVLSPPPSGASIEQCVVILGGPRDCLAPVKDVWFQKRAADLVGVRRGGGEYVDTSPWFCASSRSCPIVVGHTPVRWDGYHLTAQYAHDLAPELALSLLPAGGG